MLASLFRLLARHHTHVNARVTRPNTQVDASGNKYRRAFFLGVYLNIASMLLFTIAIGCGEWGISVLFVSRVLWGMGSGAGALGYAYLASILEHDQLTFCTLLLSIASNAGLALGPFVNNLLTEIDTELTIPGTGIQIPVNAYNAVGLLLAAFEVVNLVLDYFFVIEPKNKHRGSVISRASMTAPTGAAGSEGGWGLVFKELGRFSLLLPMITSFVASADYQLIEASFPPAAMHGLGWGPVQTSAVLGSNSLIMMFFTFVAMVLSSTYKVPDSHMIIGGLSLWVVAGSLMYHLWTFPAFGWWYVMTITIGLVGFPFIGPATQSRFCAAIAARGPELEPVQARLQAAMSSKLFLGCVGAFS